MLFYVVVVVLRCCCFTLLFDVVVVVVSRCCFTLFFVYSGTLEVDPASGFFSNTSFTLSAPEGWSDTDSPLSYQFGYYTKDERTGERREVLLGFLAKDSVLELDILPQGKCY